MFSCCGSTLVDFVSGCSPCSYDFRGGAVRFLYSLVAGGFVLFFSCCWGSALFGNKFLIIQKKKKTRTEFSTLYSRDGGFFIIMTMLCLVESGFVVTPRG